MRKIELENISRWNNSFNFTGLSEFWTPTKGEKDSTAKFLFFLKHLGKKLSLNKGTEEEETTSLLIYIVLFFN